MPDTVFVAGPPPPSGSTAGQIPRLACFLRVQFATAGTKPKQLAAHVENAEGVVLARGEWPDAIINQAFSEAESNEHPFAGFVMKLAMLSVVVRVPGDRFRTKVVVDGDERIIGEIGIRLPTASAPPSSQSPPAS
jgi:hypothetical protein